MKEIKNFIGAILVALVIFWSGRVSTLVQKSLKTFQHAQEQEPSYVQAIVLLNMLLPIVCLAGILTGAILIFCRNKWGYYIGFIFLAGYMIEQFFFG